MLVVSNSLIHWGIYSEFPVFVVESCLWWRLEHSQTFHLPDQHKNDVIIPFACLKTVDIISPRELFLYYLYH